MLPSRPDCTDDCRLRGEQRGERTEERSWELLGDTGESSGTSPWVLHGRKKKIGKYTQDEDAACARLSDFYML